MRNDSHEDCRVVTIGNGCKGISVYTGDEKELHVPWKDIVKISYKNDKFRLIYHPAEVCDKAGPNQSLHINCGCYYLRFITNLNRVF